MILRRLIEHVKTQNWIAIALDFVIVVMGVFIGIQVSNWNATRQNGALAAEYLGRLETDVALELALWDKTREYFSTARDYGRAALADFERPVEDLDERFLIALYQASQVWYVRPNRATFDELQTTGRVVFIDDADLRTALANHYVRVDATMFTFSQTSQYRRIARLNIDQRVQQAVRDACGDRWVTSERNFYYVELPSTCAIELPQDFLRAEIARLHQNDEVKRELRFHLSTLDAQLGVLRNTVDTAKATLAEIREERK